MKKLFILPFYCLVLANCGQSNKLYNINVDSKLFDISIKTYFDHGNQIVKASVKDFSDSNYLIYLVNQDGVVTNSEITSFNKEVTFTGIKSDSNLYVSKAFSSSLVETNVQPIIINDLYPDYYNGNFSDKVETKINEFKSSNTYTVDKPLLIYNAYGTDELSMYCYFNSEEKTIVNYQVVTTNHHIYSRNVETDFNSGLAYSREHEFTAHGMIANEMNYILVNSYKNLGELTSSYYISYQPKSLEEMDSMYENTSLKKETLSSVPLSDGLFALSLGQERYTPNRLTHMSMVDNYADIRWFVPMNDFFFNNIFIQDYNGKRCLVYVIDYHQLVYVNYLGQTKKVITLFCPNEFNESGKYKYFTMHHDFCFDGEGNLLTLVGKCESGVIDDKQTSCPKNHGAYVIKYNIHTDKITVPVYIDKSLLTSYRDFAMQRMSPESATDWFHPNTIQFFKETDGDYLTLSSRESSSILRVKLGDDWPNESTDSISNPPQIKWVMTNNVDVKEKETSLTYLSRKLGSEVNLPNLGQHSTYIIKEDIFPDRKLGNSEYYLAMFSNNTTLGRYINTYDFSGVPQSEMDLINNTSKNKIYIINEINNTYNCIYDKNVEYSPFMSNFFFYHSHWVNQSSNNAQISEKTLYGENIVKINFTNNLGQTLLSYRSIKIEV